VQPGDYVNIGTNLINVVPLPRVYVIANYKETQLTHVKTGQPVEITVDTFPSDELPAASSGSRPPADRNSRLLPPDKAPATSPRWSAASRFRIQLDDNQPLLSPPVCRAMSVVTQLQQRTSMLEAEWPEVTIPGHGPISARRQSRRGRFFAVASPSCSFIFLTNFYVLLDPSSSLPPLPTPFNSSFSIQTPSFHFHSSHPITFIPLITYNFNSILTPIITPLLTIITLISLQTFLITYSSYPFIYSNIFYHHYNSNHFYYSSPIT
jgi:hypothetical protein